MDAKDFLIDTDNDLLFDNGDFSVGLSDSTHIQDIITSFTGYWKQFPLCGVGIISYLNSSGEQQRLKNEINIQLKNDGYKVNSISITEEGAVKLNTERN
jgi:hypothetical protein